MAQASLSCPQQCAFELVDITIAAQRWGEGCPHKVIALHGWLDNSASFALLAPHLTHIDLVAIDLAGHGLSGDRVGSSAYNIWQDLGEIMQVAEQLGWETFSLLGHSRGAMIASLYAGAFPEHIDKLCLLDAIVPITAEETMLPEQLAAATKGLLTVSERRRTFYDAYEPAAVARMRGLYPLSREASMLLAERAVVNNDNGFYWRYDQRLLIASEIKLSESQVRAFVDVFPCVAKVILASRGYVLQQPLNSEENAWLAEHDSLDIEIIDGEHHLQLSDDIHVITRMAKIINDYFS